MSNKAIFETFFAAVTRRDHAAANALMANDFFIVEAEGLPYAGRYEGVEGWRRLNKNVREAWQPMQVSVREVLGETADTLVVRMEIAGHAGGKPFTTEILEIWRFRAGRICQITPFYFDTQALAVLRAG